MGRLEGRNVIITGASSGIGRAVLDRFIYEGANVVAVVRNTEDLLDLNGHKQVRIQHGDVTVYETNAKAVKLACTEFGGLDVFIANAGVWDFYKRITTLSPQELEEGFDQIIGVNMKGPLFAAHAAFDALRHSKGSFIVTGSNACFRAGGGGALYTSSKFGLRGLVMQLSKEFSPDIRVNGVAPGATDTPLKGSGALGHTGKMLNSDASKLEAMGKHIPLRRVSNPDEHTSLYVLLASETEANYMTGSILLSDGGLVA